MVGAVDFVAVGPGCPAGDGDVVGEELPAEQPESNRINVIEKIVTSQSV